MTKQEWVKTLPNWNLYDFKKGDEVYVIGSQLDAMYEVYRIGRGFNRNHFSNSFVAEMNQYKGQKLTVLSEPATHGVKLQPFLQFPPGCLSKIPVKQDKNGKFRKLNGKFASFKEMGWPDTHKPWFDGQVVKEEVKKPEPKPIVHREKIRDELNRLTVGKQGAVCTYGIQFADGKIRTQVQDICHARIPYGNYGREGEKNATFFAVNVAIQERGLGSEEQKKIYRRWVEYAITKSPVAKHILTKDVNEAFDKGILIDVSATISQLALTAVFLRTAHEHKYLDLWDKLCKDGIDEFTAWVVCSTTALYKEHYKTNIHGGWHHVMEVQYVDKDVLTKFRENGPIPITNVPYSQNGSHYSINASFGKTVGLKKYFENLYKKYTEVIKEDDGWGNMRDATILKYPKLLQAAKELM